MLTTCPTWTDAKRGARPRPSTLLANATPVRPGATQRHAWISVWLMTGLVAGLASSLVQTGCARGGKGATRTVDSVEKAKVDTGLSTLLSNKPMAVLPPPDPREGLTQEQKAAWANQSALQLEELLKSGELDEFGRPRPTPVAPDDATSPTSPTSAAQESASPSAPPLASVASDAPSTPAETAPATSPTPTPPTSPLVSAAAKMASLLRETDAAGKPLITDAAALTPIEAMEAGVLAALSRGEGTLTALPNEDAQTLLAARDRVLATPGDAGASLLESLRGPAPAPAAAVQTIAISRAALCVRVDGFGRFEPYPSTTFIAGRAIRAIVYTELDGFQTRAARESDRLQASVPLEEQVSVDLSQELSLYHDADGLLAWYRPAQGVVETSRSKRRDFYLIQIIDLPSTLSIGRYNLKVSVTDRVNNTQAQTILPIEIVADPGLVRGGY